MLIEGLDKLPERRPFDDRELLQHDFALLEERDDLPGAGLRGYLVGARLHARLKVAQAQIDLYGARIAHRAARLEPAEDAAQTRARLDLDARRRGGRSWRLELLLQPEIAARGCQREQGQEHH